MGNQKDPLVRGRTSITQMVDGQLTNRMSVNSGPSKVPRFTVSDVIFINFYKCTV